MEGSAAAAAVVLDSTLYDVDQELLLLAFDLRLSVYRYGEWRVSHALGMPRFEADRERSARDGGCHRSSAAEASIHWSDVRIKAATWCCYFKLTLRQPHSDRAGRNVEQIKANLHGATGTIEVHTTRDTRDPLNVSVRPTGIGPLAYQQRIRFTLVKFVDPAGRINLPKASRSAGW